MSSSAEFKRDLVYGVVPDTLKVHYIQWRRGTLAGFVFVFIVVAASFGALFVLNYFGSRGSEYVSASGSDWSADCQVQEPGVQAFMLTKNGTWSNTNSFAYSQALMRFEIPQGYNQRGDGFRSALSYFSKELSTLKTNVTKMSWAPQLLIASAKRWTHQETGIVMRYTTNPEYMMSFAFSGLSFTNVYFYNWVEWYSDNCGVSHYVNGPYTTFSWENTSAACGAFGDISSNDYFAFKVDVRSAILTAAHNSGLFNATAELEAAVGIDVFGSSYRIFHDPHYAGMQGLDCETNDGTCGLDVWQNQWYHLYPQLYHYCDWFGCSEATCACDPKNTSYYFCGYPSWVLVFDIYNSSYDAQDWEMVVQFTSDYSFPMNEYSYRFQFPNCSGEQLVPSGMLHTMQNSQNFDTGSIDGFYQCRRTVAYSVIYAASSAISVVGAVYGVLLVVLPAWLKFHSRGQITFDRSDVDYEGWVAFKEQARKRKQSDGVQQSRWSERDLIEDPVVHNTRVENEMATR
eukprot:TRINITY_DN1023_c0_g1_i4.p1 TRINITY_DN1023_c0_g1~~TRINITY_DN1023_c0_g1_i4.p1  ORF type:complete len:514 (-),score=106.22 TRINITY_DN1023_c0_g1_i4:60-1601(-)